MMKRPGSGCASSKCPVRPDGTATNGRSDRSAVRAPRAVQRRIEIEPQLAQQTEIRSQAGRDDQLIDPDTALAVEPGDFQTAIVGKPHRIDGEGCEDGDAPAIDQLSNPHPSAPRSR